MSPTNLLILYAAIIVAVSLAGGLLPSLLRLGHRSLQFVLSAVAGVMLGVGFFHMLPHAIMLRADAVAESAGATADNHGHAVGHDLLDPLMLLAVVGFLTLFLLERFFHFHHHEPESDEACDEASASDAHHHHAGCDHGHLDAHGHDGPQRQSIGWVGALAGLGVHSLLEGIALGASVVVTAHGSALAGLATFLVIVLHKPFDAMTLATLMRRGGAPVRLRMLANVLLAMLVPAGIGLFWVGATGHDVTSVAAWALAFSAGMFVCIASSDLLPELQFHRHDRVGLSLALAFGLAFAFGLARLEAGSHVHVDIPAGHDHDHDHDHAH
ncbi:MAG: ZIP family metal transporter [Phycisphaerae bacterium]|nr:ZIP family metal transporter [Phycisphaerae bacterium]